MALVKTENDYGEVTFKDFWIRKIRTIFRKLDTNGQCEIQVDDVLIIATNILANFPSISDYKSDNVVKAIVDLWYGHICGQLSEHSRTCARVLENDFIQTLRQTINGKLKENFMELIVKPLFEAGDTDDDGKITMQEFRNVMKAWHVAEVESDPVFKQLDTDRDNKITLAEFRYAFADYFYNEDQKSSIKLFGPHLVNYKRPEDYGEIDCGPFWEGKMRTMFRRMDLSNNNYLTCQDLISIARHLAKRSHLDRKKSDALLKSMLNIWVKYIAVDKEGKHFAHINEKEFIANMRAMINGEFRHEIDQFGWTFFKCVETAGDGYITQQEYRNLWDAWGVSRDEADAMFSTIDTDKDKKISHDEYLHAWCDYFLGEDHNSPYKMFFGPIISKHISAK